MHPSLYSFSPRCIFASILFGLSGLAALAPNLPAQTAHFSYAIRTTGGGYDLPRGVAVGGAGAVYVADQGNNTVKRLPPGCAASTCATVMGGGFNQPNGVAVDSAGLRPAFS